EWDSCTDPQAMLAALRDSNADERKMRLLACACARWHWDGIVEAECRHAIEVAERLADDRATMSELRNAEREIWLLGWGAPIAGEAEANEAACATVMDFAGDAAEAAASSILNAAPDLIREIFGNPFRTIGIGHQVPAQLQIVAQGIYNDDRFLELPRLADMLAE